MAQRNRHTKARTEGEKVMTTLGIYGASGFGREVMPVAEAMLAAKGDGQTRLLFIDDGMDGVRVNGFDCLSWARFAALDDCNKLVALAIADSAVRERLEMRCADHGITLANIIGPQSVVGHDVEIAPGAILCSFALITSNVRIGRSFHANIYSYVAHDCVIGDYVTFAPGVKCNGNVRIEDHAYIGTGAILKQGQPNKPLTIGRGAIVGMGAVVTKDVAPGTTVVGNPARPFPSAN
jgi:sugar O-acyltransferase (sialic acid O-acetyltransferase NeuD family)